MTLIDSKIQALLRKKAKIEYLNKVQQLAIEHLADGEEKVDATLHEEVLNMVKTFVSAAVASIERSEDVAARSNGSLTSQEISEIKTAAVATTEAITPFATPDPAVVAERKLKVEFAKKHQSLAGREVKLAIDSNEVAGKVVGLAYPNVVVETKDGVLHVSPDTLL